LKEKTPSRYRLGACAKIKMVLVVSVRAALDHKGLTPHRTSINDMIRSPKGVLQASNNKTAIVNNDVESLVVAD